jgi:hypothetical protein
MFAGFTVVGRRRERACPRAGAGAASGGARRMSVHAKLQSHTAAVSDSELERAGGRLQALTPDPRAVVEQLATRVAARVTDCLLEQARSHDRLKRALAGVYDSPGPCCPASAGVGSLHATERG